MSNVAVLGYGVVGSGVVEIIKNNSEGIKKRTGKNISVKKILDIRDFTGDPNYEIITNNPHDILDDPDIEIVVETIGGIGVAYDLTKKSILAGKSVVTSNKELIATHGPELLDLASKKGVSYLFEASVGGGIPIIRPLYNCLAANKITSILGILNGTTNYILTSMKKEGKDFQDALKEAQQKGYAEADPTADIKGHDACRKIAILSSIAFEEFLDYKFVETEGIDNITLEDIKFIEMWGGVIKLIAESSKSDDGVFARVSPAILKLEHPLSKVDDVFNAIIVKGDYVGDAMFYGRGAGKLPTASAVVADVMDIAKNRCSINTGFIINKENSFNVIPPEKIETSYYIRIKIEEDVNALISKVNSIFGGVVFLKAPLPYEKDQIAFITPIEKEGLVLDKINSLKSTSEVLSTIRVIK